MTASRRATPRILLVDDSKRVLNTLGKLLRQLGCRVVTANAGKLALQLLEAREFDLALVDVVMPGVGGLEVLARARELRSDLPVVMITGFGAEELEDEASRLGAADFLGKPFSLDELREVIEAVIGRELSPEPADAGEASAPTAATPTRKRGKRRGRGPKIPLEHERELIEAALTWAAGDRRKAAEHLEVSMSTFYRRMKALGIGLGQPLPERSHTERQGAPPGVKDEIKKREQEIEAGHREDESPPAGEGGEKSEEDSGKAEQRFKVFVIPPGGSSQMN